MSAINPGLSTHGLLFAFPEDSQDSSNRAAHCTTTNKLLPFGRRLRGPTVTLRRAGSLLPCSSRKGRLLTWSPPRHPLSPYNPWNRPHLPRNPLGKKQPQKKKQAVIKARAAVGHPAPASIAETNHRRLRGPNLRANQAPNQKRLNRQSRLAEARLGGGREEVSCPAGFRSLGEA